MRFLPVRYVLFIACAATIGCGGGGSNVASQSNQRSNQDAGNTRATVRKTDAVVALGSYNINASHVYVAGISSGGFMAVQMHFAYSGAFKGAAIYAGGPDYCAQDSETTAVLDCGGAGEYGSELAPSESYINANQNTAGMDPVSNVSGQKVYLWSGTADTVVPQKTMNDLQSEYQHYGASVTYDNGFAAEHGWESPYGTVACGTESSPYMITCDQGSTVYDSEKTWLSLFLGTLNAKNTGTLAGSLENFSQTPFGGGSNDLDTNGWVFVPANCAAGQSCSLVVAIHGCEQYQAVINNEFVTESGLDQWADTNNIVVLYPYVTTGGSNPDGCWDWWGYVNSSYALKSGPQMSAVYQMVQKLEGGTATAAPTATPAPTPTPTATPTAGPTPSPTPTPAATPTPKPTATPTATPKATPTATPTAAPTKICYTASNYAQVQAGRAYQSVGYAYADGSNEQMGLDNVYYQTTLEETSPGYWVIGCN
jgi:poly(3-hydroxybutyrate) depolymerase